jgi:hypothetical protein
MIDLNVFHRMRNIFEYAGCSVDFVECAFIEVSCLVTIAIHVRQEQITVYCGNDENNAVSQSSV